MKISTRQILTVLYIIAWVIFIGLAIEAGIIIVNGIATFALGAAGVKDSWKLADLSSLYEYDAGHYYVQVFIMSLVAVLKSLLFYQIVKMLRSKKLNLLQPFNNAVKKFIFNISYITFLTGYFSWRGINYAEWLISQGAVLPDIHELRLGGADAWIFMSVTMFIVGQIFKRGIEIQEENELTV